MLLEKLRRVFDENVSATSPPFFFPSDFFRFGFLFFFFFFLEAIAAVFVDSWLRNF